MKYYQHDHGYKQYNEAHDNSRKEPSHRNRIGKYNRILRLFLLIYEIKILFGLDPRMGSIRKPYPFTVVRKMWFFASVVGRYLKVFVDLGIGLQRTVGREVFGDLVKMFGLFSIYIIHDQIILQISSYGTSMTLPLPSTVRYLLSKANFTPSAAVL